jgi:hypothetical protein
MAVRWQKDLKMWSATRAERALPGHGYELGAFDIPATGRDPRIIGWEVYLGPPHYDELVAKGEAASFEEAKSAAVAAWADLIK